MVESVVENSVLTLCLPCGWDSRTPGFHALECISLQQLGCQLAHWKRRFSSGHTRCWYSEGWWRWASENDRTHRQHLWSMGSLTSKSESASHKAIQVSYQRLNRSILLNSNILYNNIKDAQWISQDFFKIQLVIDNDSTWHIGNTIIYHSRAL